MLVCFFLQSREVDAQKQTEEVRKKEKEIIKLKSKLEVFEV